MADYPSMLVYRIRWVSLDVGKCWVGKIVVIFVVSENKFAGLLFGLKRNAGERIFQK
jgi:hypothetical protein